MVRRTVEPHTISNHGLAFLMREEGCVLHPYNDSRGLATIGVGHLLHMSPVNAHDRARFAGFTYGDAMALLRHDLQGTYAPAVDRAVHVKLSRAEFDMLLSLAFNIGTGGFASSTVVRRLNAHDRRGAADAFMNWSKPSVLRGRRLRERARFLTAHW